MDPIQILCKIADQYPQGIHESHRMLDELTLYSLKDKNLIRPTTTSQYGMVYELTSHGWDLANSSHKLYDN
jgi:hypothetical protein